MPRNLGGLCRASSKTFASILGRETLSANQVQYPWRLTTHQHHRNDVCFVTYRYCQQRPQYANTMSRVPLLNIAEKVVLDERVDAIRRLLLDVAAFGERRGEWQGLVLRFAGGWVRDLILGIRSNDIDVALSSTTGVQFVTTLKAFVDECSNLESYGLSEDDLGRIYIVAANPEKSKQLETAAMELKGQDLDFVNLRKEVYDPQSRTPRMEFGTAKEDALRRDATINALFYNLHSQMVEDFTTGIQDMGNKLIRTPLDPQQTFTDDPLRVLRLIRFASRLDFAIDSDTRIWMGDETIREAFLSKISRERVDQEITKMFKGMFHAKFMICSFSYEQMLRQGEP